MYALRLRKDLKKKHHTHQIVYWLICANQRLTNLQYGVYDVSFQGKDLSL